MIKLAIDCMGGDYGPKKTVAGACLALAERTDLHCSFYGDRERIEQEIPHDADRTRIEIIMSDEEINSEDHPLKAIRKKQDSSMVKALKAVADGTADAFVSAGNSGAIFTGSLSIIGKLPEVKRPASVTMLPTISKVSPYYFLIDSGANIAAKPEHLVQYGKLGSKLAEHMLGAENPRIGLLNIGEEDSKGNDFTKETFQLLSDSNEYNFTGNVEPHTLMNGTHDIILTDGFTGNIMLKSVEGMAESVLNELLENLIANADLNEDMSKTVEALIHSSIRRYTNEDVGGGFILGVKAPVVITHGAANTTMFKNSIDLAITLQESDAFSSLNV